MDPRTSQTLSLLTLGWTRRLLRDRARHLLVGAVALLYAIVAMYVGEMLAFIQSGPTYTAVGSLPNLAPARWAYPALEVVTPGVTLVFPVLATVSMTVVALEVGVGMAASIVLALRLLAERKEGRQRPGGRPSMAAGLTPALLSLLTLGACCSTALASAAGVGAIPHAGSAAGLGAFADPWFLAIFQVVLVWLALVAQELLFRLYLGARPDESPTSNAADTPSDTSIARTEPTEKAAP